jgi:hypothetical protein
MPASYPTHLFILIWYEYLAMIKWEYGRKKGEVGKEENKKCKRIFYNVLAAYV